MFLIALALAAATVAHADTARRVANIQGFHLPESALHDAAQDVIFVSNINGAGTGKDNNGYIARVRADGTVEARRFIAGGQGGVTLHAPKGMALVGDTLWVADIDVLRAFDARTGRSITSIDFSGQRALFLNDVAAAPDGSLYVSDSGFGPGEGGQGMRHVGPDRIFRVAPDRSISAAMEGESLAVPNGLSWDTAGSRLLIGPLNGEAPVLAWRTGSDTLEAVADGPGGYDGIEAVGDGTFLVSSLDAGAILHLVGGKLEPVIRGLTTPADIGYDARRRRVLVPTLGENRLEIWQLP